LAIAATSKDEIDAVITEIGGVHLSLPCELSDEAQVREAMEKQLHTLVKSMRSIIMQESPILPNHFMKLHLMNGIV